MCRGTPGHVERRPTSTATATPLARARWPEVGEQAVADVDHRGGAERGGARALRRTAGSGRRCASTRTRGRPEPAAEHREPGRRPAEPAGHGDEVAGPGTGPGDRRAALERAERGDRDRPPVAAHDIAADDRRARRGGLLVAARRPAPAPTRSAGRPAAASPTSSAVGTAPIAAMSARFGGGGPVPDVGRLGPVAAEVPPLDQQVGGGHDPRVRRGEHRGVVTRARAGPMPTSCSRAVIASIRPTSPSSPTVVAGPACRVMSACCHSSSVPSRDPVGSASVASRLSTATRRLTLREGLRRWLSRPTS